MAVLFGPSPVALRVASNPNPSPPLEFGDDVVALRATLLHWNGNATTRLAVEQSFDGGVTWVEFTSTGPSPSPSGNFHGRVDFVADYVPWRVCAFTFPGNSRYRPGEICGEYYQAGLASNGTTLDHSDWAHQDTKPLVSLGNVNFHNPDLTPTSGLPLRQVQATMTVSGNVNSQLLVEAF